MTAPYSFMAILLSRFFLNLRHAHLTQNGTSSGTSQISEPSFASRIIGNLGAELNYGQGTNGTTHGVVEQIYVGAPGSYSLTSVLSSSTELEAVTVTDTGDSDSYAV